MRHTIPRATLTALAACAIVGTCASAAWATAAGSIVPSLETTIIENLAICDSSERDALNDIFHFGDREKVTGAPAAAAISNLQSSSACLDGILSMILGTSASAFDPKTRNAFKDLLKNLNEALKSDGKAQKKLLREGRAKAIRKEILKALDAKQAAKSNLQGTRGRRKDGPSNVPPYRFGVPGGPFYPNVYNANATAKYASNPVKNAGWEQFGSNGKFKRKRVRLFSDEKITIWEIRAKKRDLSTFLGFAFNRSFGPPTYFAGTLGTYMTKDKDLAQIGNARICYDALRNNPNVSFQFYGVCVQPTATGAYLLRSSENGSVGMDFYPGARQLDVMTEFNSTHFTTWAAPRGQTLTEVGSMQAGWPLPWAHLKGDLQSFGNFSRSKVGLEGLAIYHDHR